MLSVYDSCGAKGIVTGLEVESNTADKPLRKKKDLSALNILMGCIALTDLVLGHPGIYSNLLELQHAIIYFITLRRHLTRANAGLSS
jgi:hypothetical protein